MCPRFRNQSKICNIDCLGQSSLIGSIKDGVERNVLQNFVHAELVWIENHFDIVSEFAVYTGVLLFRSRQLQEEGEAGRKCAGLGSVEQMQC